MMTKELFVQFDGFLGPKPTPKREEAIKVPGREGAVVQRGCKSWWLMEGSGIWQPTTLEQG